MPAAQLHNARYNNLCRSAEEEEDEEDERVVEDERLKTEKEVGEKERCEKHTSFKAWVLY